MYNYRKHHSLGYLCNKALNKAWSFIHPDAPWLPRQTVRFLKGWLNQDHCVLEPGTGRSTIWLAKRVSRVFSIEHNKEWFDTISSSQMFTGLSNTRLNFADTTERREPFESEYVRLVASQPDQSYNLLLVDGVLRDEVALKGLAKVKAGGVILIDNAERYVPVRSNTPEKAAVTPSSPVWEEFLERVEGLPQKEFSDGVTASLAIML
jgi:predicted O-methyltransferase YrrM